ncbi:MAG: AAA family ATPase [Saccharospirillaceae bacterium]|nr:AAA family ATPase [Saccharospirillaceae bacterium]MCD8533109.1 AAA family ATPase [Saccharospirillaceae bacterium]
MVFINDRLASNSASPSSAPLSGFAFDPERVEHQLREQIIGQDRAISSIRRQLNIIKAGLNDSNRPLLTALFVGDTGVGKTEMVRCIARAIHGREEAFCRIDMNTLSQSHYSAAITGAPPGYVGSKDNLTLLNQELIEGSLTRPGIVLFDEIEKASNDVVRSLMNILDNGTLMLASGQKLLSFRNTLVFMTSNAGSREWYSRRWHQWLPQSLQNRLRKRIRLQALQRRFDHEFLNRIHCTEFFAPLNTSALPDIVQIQIQALNQRLRKRGIRIEFSANAIRWLCSTGFEQHFGARAIQRLFNQQILAPLAVCLLDQHRDQEPLTLIADVQQGQLIFTQGQQPDSGISPYPKAGQAI